MPHLLVCGLQLLLLQLLPPVRSTAVPQLRFDRDESKANLKLIGLLHVRLLLAGIRDTTGEPVNSNILYQAYAGESSAILAVYCREQSICISTRRRRRVTST